MIRIWNIELDKSSIDVHYRNFFKCDSFFFSGKYFSSDKKIYNTPVIDSLSNWTDDKKMAALVTSAVFCVVILLWITIRCLLGSSKGRESVSSNSGSEDASRGTTNSKILSKISSGDFASKSTSGASRKLTASTDSKLTSSGSTFKSKSRNTTPVRLKHSKSAKGAT